MTSCTSLTPSGVEPPCVMQDAPFGRGGDEPDGGCDRHIGLARPHAAEAMGRAMGARDGILISYRVTPTVKTSPYKDCVYSCTPKSYFVNAVGSRLTMRSLLDGSGIILYSCVCDKRTDRSKRDHIHMHAKRLQTSERIRCKSARSRLMTAASASSRARQPVRASRTAAPETRGAVL